MISLIWEATTAKEMTACRIGFVAAAFVTISANQRVIAFSVISILIKFDADLSTDVYLHRMTNCIAVILRFRSGREYHAMLLWSNSDNSIHQNRKM